MTDSKKSADLQKLCLMLYGIYAASIVLQFFPEIITFMLSLLALVIAFILTVSKKEDAKETPYASHLRWMLRTFWIGMGVVFPVALIFGVFLIKNFTDTAPIIAAVNSGDPDAIMTGMNTYIQNDLAKAYMITLAMLLPTAVWWIRRCWVGYELAKEGKAVENVTSWL